MKRLIILVMFLLGCLGIASALGYATEGDCINEFNKSNASTSCKINRQTLVVLESQSKVAYCSFRAVCKSKDATHNTNTASFCRLNLCSNLTVDDRGQLSSPHI